MAIVQREIETTLESLAAQIDDAVRAQGISYAELARRAGLHANTVGNVLHLRNTRISVVVQLAVALGCVIEVRLQPRHP